MRALQNIQLSNIRLSGRVLDVAGGGRERHPSYRKFLQVEPGVEWLMTDYDSTYSPDLCFDAGRVWPFEDETFDEVLLINSLHIFSDPQFLFTEAGRVLKCGGRFVVAPPFIFHEIAEPTDYFRFTSQGLTLLVERAGLRLEKLIPYGGRFASVAELLRPYLVKLHLFLPFAVAAYWTDLFVNASVKFEEWHPAHPGHIVIAKK